jgi:hypothetical protein
VATVTKYRCDFCKREVEDTYLEPGWIQIHGNLTRSWGTRRRGRDGDAQTDFLKDEEFCNVICLVAKLDAERKAKRGPEPKPPAPPVDGVDPFKDPPARVPLDNPLLDDDPLKT